MNVIQTSRSLAAVAVVFFVVSCGSGDSSDTVTLHNGPRQNAGAADTVIVAAGDIVCGNNTPAGTPCVQAQTANLIGPIDPDAVLVLGDNQYEDGTLAEYNALYGPTWGQYKSITWPSVGNHEYQTANASGYFDYFNGVGVQVGRAGDRAKGYYSFDVGAWHIIALNSNCGSIGGCGAGSAQEVWLKADLASHNNVCTLAYWHHPRFSSGAHGSDASTSALWTALYAAGADVVLNGHDHDYERFAPQTPAAVLDNAKGIREWVVGTGGKEQRSMGTTVANSVLRSNNSFGVLKLTLHPTSYDWQFVPIPGNSLNDAGSATCVGVPASNQAPVATMTTPANGASFVQGASVGFSGTGSDAEDGTLTGASLTWTSSRDGAIGTGTSFAKSNLTVGTHTITLTARDAQNATGTATRTITITAPTNQPPVASYTWTCTGQASPNQCAFNPAGSSDDQGIVQYRWNWGDGRSEIKASSAIARNTWAAAGTYTVTLTVTDGGGLSNSLARQIVVGTPPPNQSPTATISAPANGTSVVQGSVVSFSGSGSDPEDGALSGASLSWTSSIDGAIGTGVSFTKSNLSVGTHTITLTAKDAQNATGTATRTLTITAAPPPNQPPTATITAPTNGSSVVQGSSVSFAGSGNDPEDGSLTGISLTWTSNIDGAIGTGVSFTKSNLSVGTHTITLTATDSKGATGTAARTITVTAAPPVNQPPVARFTWTCTGQPNPHQCAFDASTSSDDAGVVNYTWSWGDGRTEQKTVPTTRNTWAAAGAGTYQVTLTVRDAAGLTNAVTKAVIVP